MPLRVPTVGGEPGFEPQTKLGDPLDSRTNQLSHATMHTTPHHYSKYYGRIITREIVL